MAQLLLETELDTLDLNEVQDKGAGFQAMAGVTGLGLPPVNVQWLEGAGDGARWRGQRVLSRDVDLPLDIVGRDRTHLRELIARLARALAGECSLVLVDETGVRWSTLVYRTGGGEITLGSEDARDVQTVVTFRAADPYFTASTISAQKIGGDTTSGAFLSSLVALPVAASQAIGEITLDNTGDVDAYPLWEVYGPGRDLTVKSPSGETLRWTGTLTAGEKLIVDTRAGTVVDGTRANRYGLLAPAPRFWTIRPGVSTATASLLDTTSTSKIVCSWQPRKWMVI